MGLRELLCWHRWTNKQTMPMTDGMGDIYGTTFLQECFKCGDMRCKDMPGVIYKPKPKVEHREESMRESIRGIRSDRARDAIEKRFEELFMSDKPNTPKDSKYLFKKVIDIEKAREEEEKKKKRKDE